MSDELIIPLDELPKQLMKLHGGLMNAAEGEIMGDENKMQHALGLISKSKADNGDTVYEIIASNSSIDRDNEIIEPDAWSGTLPKYLRENPVILWAHQYRELPIGRAVGGKIKDDQLRLNIVFDADERSQLVKSKYDSGSLNSFSVGFIPKKWERDQDDILHFKEVELLEVSAVPVPANAGANMLRNQNELALIGKSLLNSWTNREPIDEPTAGKPERSKRKLTFAQKRGVKNE